MPSAPHEALPDPASPAALRARHAGGTHHVRSLRRDEIPQAADLLSRSFWDDPLQEWFHPTARNRYHRMHVMFTMELRVMWHKGVIHTTDDLSGVAIWAAPNRWRSTPADLLQALIPSIRAFGRQLPPVLRAFSQIEAAHPREPHWYLATLATDPGRAGLGVGSRLVRTVTDRCDRDGIAAYLESSKAENVPFYQRLGFELLEPELDLRGGPTVFPMWRDPRL